MLLNSHPFTEKCYNYGKLCRMKGLIKINVDFSNEDILLIYGHFGKKINELNSLKNHPNNPIHVSNINQDIKLFSSITDKIEKTYPQLREMNKYL